MRADPSIVGMGVPFKVFVGTPEATYPTYTGTVQVMMLHVCT